VNGYETAQKEEKITLLSGSNREGVIAFRVGASEFSFRIFDCSGVPLRHLPTASQSDVSQTSMRQVACHATMPDCRSFSER